MKPRIFDDQPVPETVNGWRLDRDDRRNAWVWRSPDGTKSVCVQVPFEGSVPIYVEDDRVRGGESSIEIRRINYDVVDDIRRARALKKGAVGDGIEVAIDWMNETGPSEWSNPAVKETVFDAPPGHELEIAYFDPRQTQIYYKRNGATISDEALGKDPDELTLADCPYLYLHVWNGSGDAVLGLSRWTNVHGVSSKHEAFKRLLEKDGCGIVQLCDIARQYAAEQLAVPTP